MFTFVNARLLPLIRRIHLYLSVFFAPLLLLFIITGWAQTVGYQTSLMTNFSKVHTGQYFPMTKPIYGPKGEELTIAEQIGTGYTLAGQIGTGKGSSQIMTSISLTKGLIVAMCVALMVSISLGLILAFTMVRNKIPVLIALTLGVITPVLFLALAHVK